ncbi:nuclear transport factor 2 family protein [Ruficoccus amylovorans]|uniref:Nuclear transport factor 2 family protein n=1 Tax=Ruficoccus amylovorans TaxID=1804625 RepID=A0A842HG99_9BACT|nr:nuclear transport factor 2 family protein [Ruficoccus amylovorans]MBC2595553.1 nuclear transport factor 2 family protein [Ruficoccus amylovorans]
MEGPESLLETYGRAVNARDAAAVAACFAAGHSYRVHGLGDGASAWNSKAASTPAAIEEEYRRFFELVESFEARYTDRIVDLPGRSIACVVRVAGKNRDGSTFDMANALHLAFDPDGKISVFRNWYGCA